MATNSGNLTLSAMSISDPKLGTLTCTPAHQTTLSPGASLSCARSYTIPQADLDTGAVKNTATASGTDTNSKPVSATASAEVDASAMPALALTKTPSTTTY